VNSPDTLGNSREAEKAHVARMQTTEGLGVRPFLAGTSLSVERAQVEIAIFSAMVASLPVGPGALVLDLGAGPCWVSHWLRKLRYRTCSLDISLDMLRIGRERMGKDSWVCAADMAAIPLRDESVDAAVCYAALHHVPNWQDVVREVYRVLRPGGVLVLQEPGKGHSREAESITQMAQFGVLEQDLPPRLLARVCRDAGFSRTVVRPVAELSHGLTRILPPYPFLRHAPRLFVSKCLRRVLATVVERTLNCFTPLHVVVAMKGTPYADSRRPDTMVARFEVVDVPATVRGDRPTPIRVRVLNTGLTRWQAEAAEGGLGRVRLGVSRLDGNRRIQDLDFLRVSLTHDVVPGERVELEAELPPLPQQAGPASLRLDMVSEGVCWFSDKGSRPVFRDIEVRA
jgi:ubiquinone/menaquinone biosynthesis C-methylase UbiE